MWEILKFIVLFALVMIMLMEIELRQIVHISVLNVGYE